MNNNVEKLIENNPDLAAYISAKDNEINHLKKEKEALLFSLSKLNRNIFGKKSEKSTTEIERNLFNLNEAEENQNALL